MKSTAPAIRSSRRAGFALVLVLGFLVTNFKLYSSDVMTTTGALTSEAPAKWSGSAFALWTDLNAPVTLPDFAAAANSNKTLDAYYKFRVVSTKRFDP